MRRLAGAVALFAAVAWAETTQPSAPEQRLTDTLTVRTGLGPWVAPEAGVAWGHHLTERLIFTLAFYGAREEVIANADPTAPVGPRTVLTLEPGARFLLNRVGVFVGANLAGGYALTQPPGYHLRTLAAGGDLLAGLSHVFDGFLAVEIYAGLAARTFFETSDFTGKPLTSSVAVFALRAGFGVGWAF